MREATLVLDDYPHALEWLRDFRVPRMTTYVVGVSIARRIGMALENFSGVSVVEAYGPGDAEGTVRHRVALRFPAENGWRIETAVVKFESGASLLPEPPVEE